LSRIGATARAMTGLRDCRGDPLPARGIDIGDYAAAGRCRVRAVAAPMPLAPPVTSAWS
jgi:hypothetical protein